MNMRSRYSAFVLGRPDDLRATRHASIRPTDLTLNPAAKWLGLHVRSPRVVEADRTEVKFVARLRESVRVVRMHERSRFVRASGAGFTSMATSFK